MPPRRKRSHYETLGVEENCTSQEIKAAYVTLSKRYHPDKSPNDPDESNKKFVTINEAYSILSKPDARKQYDLMLRNYSYNQNFTSTIYNKSPPPVWRDESIWSMRDRKNDKRGSAPYYGIPGIKRVSNLWIAGGAVLLMTIGTIFHYVALKTSSAFSIARLNLRDERLGEELNRARRTAALNGNEMQINILRERLEPKNED